MSVTDPREPRAPGDAAGRRGGSGEGTTPRGAPGLASTAHDEGESSLPPTIGTWRRAYALVLGALAVEIVLFWLLGVVYGGAA